LGKAKTIGRKEAQKSQKEEKSGQIMLPQEAQRAQTGTCFITWPSL
jgi:hypothetical protein